MLMLSVADFWEDMVVMAIYILSREIGEILRSSRVFSCHRDKNKEEQKTRFSSNIEKFRLNKFC